MPSSLPIPRARRIPHVSNHLLTRTLPLQLLIPPHPRTSLDPIPPIHLPLTAPLILHLNRTPPSLSTNIGARIRRRSTTIRPLLTMLRNHHRRRHGRRRARLPHHATAPTPRPALVLHLLVLQHLQLRVLRVRDVRRARHRPVEVRHLQRHVHVADLRGEGGGAAAQLHVRLHGGAVGGDRGADARCALLLLLEHHVLLLWGGGATAAGLGSGLLLLLRLLRLLLLLGVLRVGGRVLGGVFVEDLDEGDEGVGGALVDFLRVVDEVLHEEEGFANLGDVRMEAQMESDLAVN